MNSWFKSSLRFVVVTVGIIFLTSFSIDATDSLRNSQTALSILSEKITTSSCPEGMIKIQSETKSFCIDVYESSPGSDCVYEEPKSTSDTTHNIADKDCAAVSVKDAVPWTFAAKPQAAQLCAKSGKRLPTAEEWFLAAGGTPDNLGICNLAGGLNQTGFFAECTSGFGVYDMIGNVWELVSDSVENGMYKDRLVPEEGYVYEADDSGIALSTNIEPNTVYNQDYFWSNQSGNFVMMRGGFYGSKNDGGIYAVHAQADNNFASAAVGFRCVLD